MLKVDVDQKQTTVELVSGDALTIELNGEDVILKDKVTATAKA